mmetsp:Transcript_32708/g.52671  ORF Transcript_32708/g.52671 Transcript_32708/m.52671 type:complete len:84 (-) Transcript_32708:323-574(-)
MFPLKFRGEAMKTFASGVRGALRTSAPACWDALTADFGVAEAAQGWLAARQRLLQSSPRNRSRTALALRRHPRQPSGAAVCLR